MIQLKDNGQVVYGLARDHSGAIINTNNNEYLKFKTARDKLINERLELIGIKTEISEIKGMMQSILIALKDR
jgi:hypothetical protein